MLPLTIFGGYLGAGKTTLINRLLANPPAAFKGKRLTILVNDFGAINIDAELIEAHDGDTISLANGCACCQLQDDALQQLQQLAKSDTRPDHVLIEASGAGEPARLAYLGYGIQGLQLAGIYVAIDATTLAAKRRDKFVGGLINRQIAQADYCLLTKADLTDDEGASAQHLLASLTQAPLAHPSDEVLADMLTLSASSALPDMADTAPLFADTLFDTMSFSAQAPLDIEKLTVLLDEVAPKLARAKGHTGTHRLQLVGERYTLLEAERRAPELVFIVEKGKLDLAALTSSLKALSE
ncbi:MAG: GTP-binding protein [Alphaproteobacteria bacterium]|nr:GTP-binding protein [Alphaproteobacteria bacterium]